MTATVNIQIGRNTAIHKTNKIRPIPNSRYARSKSPFPTRN